MSRDKIKELLLETKTITEFMGNTVDYIIETNEYGVKGEPLTCYNYSTSWDHLMPVIEKIESLDLSDWYDKGNFANVNVSIESGHCYIFVELNYDPSHRVTGLSNFDISKIELIYSQVIAFIKWCNDRIK
tara:strand:- start:377 stop:766 length:390 start_codon:yes stop_codon:yes gene_type:complete